MTMIQKCITFLERIYKDPLIKNSMYLTVTYFCNSILGFFFWIVATRYYTPDDIGITSAILSSVFLISTISLIGLPISLIFYLPKYSKNANNIINSCLIVGIIVSIIFSLIFLLGIDIWAPKLKSTLENLEIMIIFIITTIMTTMASLMSGTFTAGKRSSFHMIRENIFGLTKIFLLILFLGFGSIGIFISWSLGLIISIIIGFFLLFKLWKYVPTFTFDPVIKNMARFSIGNHIGSICYNLPKLIFPIMIMDLISTESAGYFFIAMTISGLLYAIPTSIVGPFLVESSNKEKFWDNVNNTIKFSICILVPGLLLFAIFGKFILNIFNPNYADHSFITLIILSVTSIPLSLIIIFNAVRNAQEKILTTIIVNAIICITTIALSIPLMKIWNIEGAAMAYLIANTIMASIIIFRMKDPIEFSVRLIKGDKKNISA